MQCDTMHTHLSKKSDVVTVHRFRRRTTFRDVEPGQDGEDGVIAVRQDENNVGGEKKHALLDLPTALT